MIPTCFLSPSACSAKQTASSRHVLHARPPIGLYFRLATTFFCISFSVGSAHAQSATPWWRQAKTAKTKHYALKTDLPSAEAKELARHMDATFSSYVRTFSQLPVRVRTPAALGLFLFENQQDYLTTLPVHFRANGQGSWGMCITRGKSISLVGYRGHHTVEQMKPLLQHEGFHQFASHLFPDLPPWANEGLAEVFERGVVVSNRLVLGDIPKSDRTRLTRAIREKEALPIQRLLQIDSKQWNTHVQSSDAGLQYLQAWSLVQYFLFGEDARHQKKFLGFLVQLNAGNRERAWESSFVSTFGWVDWAELQRRWEAYVLDTDATDLRDEVRCVEYLAAGMLALREDDVYPASQAELIQSLIEKQFQRTKRLYGAEQTQRSQNQLMLRLQSEQAETQPAEAQRVRLKFTDARGRAPSKSYTAKKSPKPLNIATVGLHPRDLKIVWKRNGKQYRYEILAN